MHQEEPYSGNLCAGRKRGYNNSFRKTLDGYAICSNADDDTGEFIGSAEEVLFGMGATLY
ncbi:MAG: hypothetical protein HGA55_05660 [Methanoregulaceae archaeon]|nr:hypothetical protein [Methanoregulaceae archaeon]